MFPSDTMFVTGVGLNKRVIDVNHIRFCLVSKKVRALLGLHALSGMELIIVKKEKKKKIALRNCNDFLMVLSGEVLSNQQKPRGK